MKTLPPPVGDFLERYRQAVRGKEREDYRATLEALEGAVDGRYDEYQEKKKTLENVMVIERTADQISALESCYSQTLKRELLNNLRDRLPKFDDEALFEGAPPRLRCPYCQIEPASRWDHFLPSSIFQTTSCTVQT